MTESIHEVRYGVVATSMAVEDARMNAVVLGLVQLSVVAVAEEVAASGV